MYLVLGEEKFPSIILKGLWLGEGNIEVENIYVVQPRGKSLD